MVDAGIKKVKIPFEEFPLVQFTTTKTAVNILSVSGNGTTVTYTTASPHNLLVGQRVKILGVLPISYNLDGVLINAVLNPTTFTVLNNASGSYISGGTIQVYSTYDTVNNIFIVRDYADELYYDFRYRVISEDKNRFSHWSSIQRNIQPDITDPFPYTNAESSRFSVTKSGDIITAIWSFPGDSEIAQRMLLDPEDANYLSEEEANYIKIFRKTRTFDVWVRWADDPVPVSEEDWEDWEYEATVSTNSFSILKRVDIDVKRIEIAVQVPTTRKLRDYNNNKLTLFRGLSGTI
jgi:hypothetical protein